LPRVTLFIFGLSSPGRSSGAYLLHGRSIRGFPKLENI